jgi:hypothetical protein
VCHETLLALHKIKIIIHLASVLILTSLFSCQNDKKSSGNVVESQQQSEFHTDFQTAQFETQFSEVKCFMNGDSILHAQNAIEWKKACNDKKPAWCYADEKNKNGLLYNYYALSDKRGIIPNPKKLTLKIAEKLKNELVHRKKEWTLEFVDKSYVQRAFNGRNYNLKFVQFWIFDEEHLSDNQAQIMVWDLKLKKFTIELASVNNGYRIWLLK